MFQLAERRGFDAKSGEGRLVASLRDQLQRKPLLKPEMVGTVYDPHPAVPKTPVETVFAVQNSGAIERGLQRARRRHRPPLSHPSNENTGDTLSCEEKVRIVTGARSTTTCCRPRNGVRVGHASARRAGCDPVHPGNSDRVDCLDGHPRRDRSRAARVLHSQEQDRVLDARPEVLLSLHLRVPASATG